MRASHAACYLSGTCMDCQVHACISMNPTECQLPIRMHKVLYLGLLQKHALHVAALNARLARCRFAFDPVTKEAYREGELDGSFKKSPVKGAYYYYRLAGNVVWLVLAGWALALGHLMAAMVSVGATAPHCRLQAMLQGVGACACVSPVLIHEVQVVSRLHALNACVLAAQALTIIGLGTAWTNIRLMLFAIWPFGQAIRDQVSIGSCRRSGSDAHTLAVFVSISTACQEAHISYMFWRPCMHPMRHTPPC